MSLGILARKIGMESVFVEDKLVPCTILQTFTCTITQIKTRETDGYDAVQIAADEQKEKNTTKARKGHFTKANTTPKKKVIEFRNFKEDYTDKSLKLGDTISVDHIFTEEEYIDATGISKGKGFCGVVKRYNFKGAKEATHGQKHTLRAPGSIGNVKEPVRKGKKMAGRTGNKTIKIKNLKVLKIIPEENIIVLKGSLPGPRNTYITLQK